MISKIVVPYQTENSFVELWISLLIHFNCVSTTVKTIMPNVSVYKLLLLKIFCSANIYSRAHYKIQSVTYNINWITLESITT